MGIGTEESSWTTGRLYIYCDILNKTFVKLPIYKTIQLDSHQP